MLSSALIEVVAEELLRRFVLFYMHYVAFSAHRECIILP